MRAINDLKIAVKLTFCFGLLALLTIVVSGLGYTRLSSVGATNSRNVHSYEVLAAVNDISQAMMNQEGALRGYLVSNDPSFLDRYRAGRVAYGKAFASLTELTADNAAQQTRLGALSRFIAHWSEDIADREIALVEAGSLDKARTLLASGAGRTAMDGVRAELATIETVERDLLAIRSADQARSFATASHFTILGGIASVAIAALLAFLANLMLARPLVSLVAVLQRMARGEIESEIAEARRGDEIGAVGRAVEGIKAMVTRKAVEEAEIRHRADEAAAEERKRTMIALADGFERTVGGIVGRVSSSATELQATAQTMTAIATEAASQSATVATAAEVAAANVETVAVAAEELGSSVQEIGRQVSGSASLARAAVEQADRTGMLVQDLSQAAIRIGGMVGLISNIAGQTNLLALNATIEAARAGEAGRGFAVVGTEVKELAGQTARATSEIGAQIEQIQAATGEAVAAIGGITARIREIDGVATALAAAVEQQGAATQEIVRNVSQASAGTTEVTTNIAGVAQASDETGTAAGQVLSAASELSRQSVTLGAEVSRFLTTVRAA